MRRLKRVARPALGWALSGWFLLHAGSVPAWPAPRYAALETAAIAVKAPAAAPLVAVVRAGRRLVAAGLHGVIVVSADNGQTWRQAAVPVDLTLTAIYFGSAEEGWAVGHYGVILHTTDGGLDWTKALDGRDVVNALDAAAGQAKLGQPASPDMVLRRRVATAFQAAGPSKPFLAIGECGGGILAAGQQDMAMFSGDGGKSWQEWTSRIANPDFLNIYDIIGAGPATFLIGEQGLVLKSTAGCMNFTPVARPYTSTLFGGIISGANQLLVYGLDGGVFASGDGGAHWAAAPIPASSVNDAGVLLDSGSIMLGTVGGNLYLSDKSWTKFHQSLPTLPFQIAGIAVAPNGNLVTVGNDGINIFPTTMMR